MYYSACNHDPTRSDFHLNEQLDTEPLHDQTVDTWCANMVIIVNYEYL